MTVPVGAGLQARIRPISPDDKRALAAGFAELSEESRYRRFLSGTPRLTDRALAYLTEVDHHDHEALVAESAESGEILGVARFVRAREDPTIAEVGIAVVDHAQGRGIGGALLERLAGRAREEGIRRFNGLALADNRAVTALFGELGAVKSRPGADAGTVELEVDIPAPPEIGDALRQWLRAAARRKLRAVPPGRSDAVDD